MDYELRSYLIYFGLMFACFILASQAYKRNNTKLVFLIALLLSLVMGLREKTVGVDTINYYNLFGSIRSISQARKQNDPIFYIIAYLLMKIKDDPYFPIFVFSTAINFLCVYRLWEYREFSSFKYSLLRYVSIFFLFAMNCMRQFLSISIVFWATRYLDKKEYDKYLIFVGIASTIHIASLVGASFIILDSLQWNNLSRKQKNLVNLSILGLPAYYLISRRLASGRYEHYFTNVTITGWQSLIIKVALLVAVILVEYNDNKKSDKKYAISMTYVYYFIGLLAIFLGVYYRFMERIGYYFYIYSTVYTGIAAREKKYRLLVRVFILFIVIRAYYLNCYSDSMGQMPYLFNWE